MKVELKIDDQLEDKIVIHAQALTPEIQKLYEILKEHNENNNAPTDIVGYQEDMQYYVKINSILFFETIDEVVYAHTVSDSYIIRNRLYQLEKTLPTNFMRISKTTIMNINYLYAVESGIGGPRLIRFTNSNKGVYVSRKYYPLLKEKLKERL